MDRYEWTDNDIEATVTGPTVLAAGHDGASIEFTLDNNDLVGEFHVQSANEDIDAAFTDIAFYDENDVRQEFLAIASGQDFAAKKFIIRGGDLQEIYLRYKIVHGSGANANNAKTILVLKSSRA